MGMGPRWEWGHGNKSTMGMKAWEWEGCHLHGKKMAGHLPGMVEGGLIFKWSFYILLFLELSYDTVSKGGGVSIAKERRLVNLCTTATSNPYAQSFLINAPGGNKGVCVCGGGGNMMQAGVVFAIKRTSWDHFLHGMLRPMKTWRAEAYENMAV